MEEQIDILPSRKEGDSSCKRLISQTENILSRIDIAIMRCTTLRTSSFSYSKLGLLRLITPQHEQDWVVLASLTSINTEAALR